MKTVCNEEAGKIVLQFLVSLAGFHFGHLRNGLPIKMECFAFKNTTVTLVCVYFWAIVTVTSWQKCPCVIENE
jgi:hypothetical protein